MNNFNQNILIIGCGAVAQCTIPLIIKELKIDPKKITVIDIIDKSQQIKKLIELGVKFQVDKISKENYKTLLMKYLNQGDICIELGFKIGTIDILNWCQNNNIRYLNTDLNDWNGEISVYDLYNEILKIRKKITSNTPTAILSHGINPGLVTSFVKQALLDIATQIILENTTKEKIKCLENYIAEKNFAGISEIANIKTIHISEEDSQISQLKNQNDTFINTWSAIEFFDECESQIEFAWGTHEKIKPKNSEIKNGKILINKPAFELKVKSFVYNKEIIGILPPHTENFTIADYLTINDNKTIYRPTVSFVYSPCPQAQESLINFKNNKKKVTAENSKIIKEEITSGYDNVGCLLIGPQFSWWAGSVMNIEECRKIFPNQNVTTMQVAAGVIAALDSMLRYPKKGILFPEDLDHNLILVKALPYLGKLVSQSVNWLPKNSNLEFQNFLV